MDGYGNNFELIEDRYFDVDDIDGIIDNCFTQKITKRFDTEIFEDVLAFDIETSSFTIGGNEPSFSDADCYNLIRSHILKYSDSVKHDIPDFESLRRRYLGIITLSQTSGEPIDTFYEEIRQIYPGYFPEGITAQSDQLLQILSVIDLVRPDDAEDGDKVGLMYVWQLAINGRVIIGRTWEDLFYVLNKIAAAFHLNSKRRMIIYVHNLAYEFQFMRKFFNWIKVFAIAPRKPIYGITDIGFEFRCSYILSNYSLAKLAENLQKYKVKKMVGDLDYTQIRTPDTLLTDKELHYCINDVLVVSAYIKEEIEHEKSITRIPLTCTGYCRNYVRNKCLTAKGHKAKSEQFNRYHNMIKKLSLDPDEYKQLQRAFMGGFTHCSARYSGTVQENVDSFDFTSSYPAVLLSERYPMSKAEIVKIESPDDLKHNLDLYCCLFDVQFIGLEPVMINENYIPKSKCHNIDNAVTNNGRIVSADSLIITLTDIDFKIIEKTYRWKKMKIGTFRRYQRGYLPKEIIMAILKLYQDKTQLKGVDGKEVEYLKSKGLLNSIYGMMVTNIMRELNEYIDGVWSTEYPDENKAIKKYNNSKKRFLFYPWGVWCTAYARANLWSGILAFGDDYIYSDTDSLKVLNAADHMDYIESYNKNIITKLYKMADHYGIEHSLLCPKTIKGVEKMIGVWDWETESHKYLFFKSLGAKRYMVLTDKLSITVSGVNKHAAVPYLLDKYGERGCFDAFNMGLHIPGDYTGKLTHYYIDDEISGTITDYQGHEFDFTAPSGIYLEKASYDFDMALEYIEYLEKLRGVRI